MLIVFFLECGHENQEGGHINFQAEHRSISGRTKKSRNNKSSCIAERQAVLVSWTHPEKRRHLARFQMLWQLSCRVVHFYPTRNGIFRECR